MRRIALLSVFLASFNLHAFNVLAQQDSALTRNVALQNAAAGKQLSINQIDTSQFPHVNIFATVLDGGVPVTGLSDKDFRVREDEVDQEPIKVVPQLSPLSVVVTIDTSGSMSKAMAQTKEAAKSFLDSLDSADNVATLSFARAVTPLSNFATDKSQGKTAIDSVVARGDTALYDALYASVEAVKQRPGRKAVALLSDGVDDDGSGKQLSKHSVDEVLALAKEVNVPIFTIGLGTQIDKAVLERVAQETGAQYFSAPTVEELKALYASLGKQLTGQYNILYTSNLPGDGSTHRVQLSQNDLKASKEYLSPKVGGAAPVVVAAPVNTPSTSTGPIEIEGGLDFDSAVVIEPDTAYFIKSKGAGGTFFRLKTIPAGTRVGVYSQQHGIPGNAEVEVFNSSKARVVHDICAGEWCSATNYFSVSKESDGNFYFQVRRNYSGAYFGYHVGPVGDLGKADDAGAKEKLALPIDEGVTYLAFVSTNGDKDDTFKAKLTAGKKRFRARPAAECGISMEAIDDNGSIWARAYTPNDGAGFSKELEIKEPSTQYFRIEAKGPGSCPFAFVIGDETVEAPEQPEHPFYFKFPNFRK